MTSLPATPHANSSTLSAGESLGKDDFLLSADGKYKAYFYTNGIFCIVDIAKNKMKFHLESSSLDARQTGPGQKLAMAADGNCYIENASGEKVWETGSSGFPGSELRLSDGGFLSLYSQNGVVLWSTSPTSPRIFQIETMGRAGKVYFDTYIGAKPTEATLTIYDQLVANDNAGLKFNLVEGQWNGTVFEAKIQSSNTRFFSENGIGFSTSQFRLKIKFDGHKLYGFIGAGEREGFASYRTALIFHDVIGPKQLPVGSTTFIITPTGFKNGLPDKKFATLIYDCSGKSYHEGYSYHWWSKPTNKNGSNFEALHLINDHVRNEIALYKFPSNPTVPLTFKNLDGFLRYRIAYCSIGDEVVSKFKELLPDIYPISIKSAIVAQLVRYAATIYPSNILVLKSDGHGSGDSIMNQLVSTEDIDQCFTWITKVMDKPIDLFDFSTNCEVASLDNIYHMSKHSRYIMASDVSIYPSYLVAKNLRDYFDPTKTLEQITLDMMKKLEEDVELPKPVGMTIEQVTLFKSDAFAQLLQGIINEKDDITNQDDALADIKKNAKLTDSYKEPEFSEEEFANLVSQANDSDETDNGDTDIPADPASDSEVPSGDADTAPSTPPASPPQPAWWIEHVDLKYLIEEHYPTYKAGSFQDDWKALIVSQVNNKDRIKENEGDPEITMVDGKPREAEFRWDQQNPQGIYVKKTVYAEPQVQDAAD